MVFAVVRIACSENAGPKEAIGGFVATVFL
jgi:hypothetical protein